MTNEVCTLAQQLICCGNDKNSNAAVQKLLMDSIGTCCPQLTSIEAGGTVHALSISGTTGPLLLFVGHSDVVSTGDEALWQHAPFSAQVDSGVLFGRGSVDMRAATAAFCVALKNVWSEVGDSIQVGIAITGDEETKASGAPAIVEHLKANKLSATLCLVGEPSSVASTGDKIRIGRRGSLTCTFLFSGNQGHTAYLGADSNVLHAAVTAANALSEHIWPTDPEPWPAVNFHLTNFSSGTGENGVVPPTAEFRTNIRFGPSLSREQVIKESEAIVSKALGDNKASWESSWTVGSKPYFTSNPKIPNFIAESIKKVTGALPEQAVDGGSSDGRFFSASGIPTVEVGTVAKGLHEVNEQLKLSDLDTLVELYTQILRDFAANAEQL